MAAIITQLETHTYDEDGNITGRIPQFILGDDQKALFEDIYTFWSNTRNPICLIGPPGCSKTHLMKQLLIRYAQDHDCRAFWCQVDPETARSTLIGGHRFENVDGATAEVPFLAVVGESVRKGDAVGIDELGHGEPFIQTGFNSVLDKDSILSLGDLTVKGHKRARFVFGTNESTTPGNSGFYISFAFRLRFYKLAYPRPQTEALIAKSIAADSLGSGDLREGIKKITVPDGVVKFLVSYARDIRAYTLNHFPIAARNVAMMIESLVFAPRDTTTSVGREWDEPWQHGTSSESIRQMVAERIMFQPIQSDADLHNKQVDDTLRFIASLDAGYDEKGNKRAGRERFLEIVKSCMAFDANLVDIPTPQMDDWRIYAESHLI